jgi:hypothetical protein
MCDLLVLVCPNCSEVLPDGKLPPDDLPTYEFLPNEFRPSESPPEEFTPAPISKSESNNIALGKVVLFLIAFALAIWLLSGPGK